MILRGQGVPQDTADALIRFQKLAQLHYEWAQFALGTIYRDGLWVPKDSLEAVKCFRMAAEQGNESAKAMLREMADSSK
jgi:TPR repeat protein